MPTDHQANLDALRAFQDAADNWRRSSREPISAEAFDIIRTFVDAEFEWMERVGSGEILANAVEAGAGPDVMEMLERALIDAAMRNAQIAMGIGELAKFATLPSVWKKR